MGVKGLFQFLKRFERDVQIAEALRDKSVGVDIFYYIHKSKGDMFAFQNYLVQITKYAKEVHVVYDGTSQEKKDESHSVTKKEELTKTIQELDRYLKYPFRRISKEDRKYIGECLAELKCQAWQPPPEYIKLTKEWLKSKGVTVHQAQGEADGYLVLLEKIKSVDIIITNDSDLLTLGARAVLRPVSPVRLALFDKEELCSVLGFTGQQWRDFMYLCKNMKNTDILLAYSMISVYKDLDYVLQKYELLYGADLILCN